MRLAPQVLQKIPPFLALMLSVGLIAPKNLRGQTSLSLQAGARASRRWEAAM